MTRNDGQATGLTRTRPASRFPLGVIRIAGALLLAASVAPRASGAWWVLELASHFRLHLALAAALLFLVALLRRDPVAAVPALAAAAICGRAVAAVPVAPPAAAAGPTILSQNLEAATRDHRRMVAFLQAQDPDILVVQEYTPAWHDALTPVAERYRSQVTVPRNGPFGAAVFSKIPITSWDVIESGVAGIPFVTVTFDPGVLSARLVVVHCMPPMTSRRQADRDLQLDRLKPYLQSLDEPFVAIGDFNNTPASPSFSAFVDGTDWHLAGPTWQGTWPAGLGRAGIAIDLAVGSADVRFGPKHMLPRAGSDHRGFRVGVSVAEP